MSLGMSWSLMVRGITSTNTVALRRAAGLEELDDMMVAWQPHGHDDRCQALVDAYGTIDETVKAEVRLRGSRPVYGLSGTDAWAGGGSFPLVCKALQETWRLRPLLFVTVSGSSTTADWLF